jgi:predicted nucleic acid-binding protein
VALAFTDALILAAAIEADCDTVLSEDMQDGGKVGGVTIRNPFRGM